MNGLKRNHIQFWKKWAEKYPGTLSEANLERINRRRNSSSSIVDQKWIEYFPEHQNYLDNILIHHHLKFRNKIYFWEHEMEVEDGEIPDYSNLTLIADSFDEFINSLKSEDKVEA